MDEFNWFSIFSYKKDEYDEFGSMTFYGVKFLKDFGKIKKGKKFTSVNFSFESGEIECWDEETEKFTCQNFYFSPVELN